MQPFDIALENMERITAMIDDWKFIDAARHCKSACAREDSS
jgi:hypothetical protein